MSLDEVLDGTDALVHLDDAHEAAWACTDPALLEACRRRIAEHLGADTDVTPSAAVDVASADPELLDAALLVTDQYLVDVAGLTDEDVGRLREHLGDQGLVDFLHALLVVEQRIRLELIWESVL